MKFFATNLIKEEVLLIREACMNEVLMFLQYLKKEDINSALDLLKKSEELCETN
jgi:hypothetical protein